MEKPLIFIILDERGGGETDEASELRKHTLIELSTFGMYNCLNLETGAESMGQGVAASGVVYIRGE